MPQGFYKMGLLVLVLLAVALRWAFGGDSTIQIWADTQEYWGATLQIRDAICEALPLCTPQLESPVVSAYDLLLSRSGWLPHLLALTQLTDSPDPQRSYALFILLDASIVLMLAASTRRLGMSPQIALTVAGLYAVYVPAIISSGTLLRHPLERWLVMLMIWTYLQNRRGLFLAGSILFSLMGFQFRVLTWLVWGLMLLRKEERPFWLRSLVIYGLILLGVAFAIHPSAPPLSAVYLGYGDAALSNHLGSIAAHETFWIPDSAYEPNYYHPATITEQVRAHPQRFLERLPRSIFYTWIAPENTYFQNFILNLPQQYSFYQILLALSLIGWAWLIFQHSEFWHLYLILGVMIALTTLISAALSVEQRRIALFIPVVLLGVGGCLQAKWRPKMVLALGLTTLTWVLPYPKTPLWWYPETIRVLFLLTTLILLLRLWKIEFLWQRASILGAGLLIGLVSMNARYHQSHTWRYIARQPLEQEITHFRGEDHLIPWVLLDIKPRQPLGEEVALYANDQLIKPLGDPLYIWQLTRDYAPVPSFSLENGIAQVTPRRWYAFPLPPEFRHAETITLRLEMEKSIVVYSDVLTTKPRLIPAFSPTGFSVFQWLWNGSDMRLAVQADLNGEYRQSYRIFVVNQPYGGQNNALRVPDAYYLYRPNEGDCPQGKNLLPVMTRLRLCEYEDHTLAFYSHTGDLIQELAPILPATPQQLLVQIPLSDGSADLIYADLNLYVLNFWSNEGALQDSVTFRLDYPYQDGERLTELP